VPTLEGWLLANAVWLDRLGIALLILTAVIVAIAQQTLP
jgi:hypothetical protein